MSLITPHARIRHNDLDHVPPPADAAVGRGARVGDVHAAAAEGVGAEGWGDGGEEGGVGVRLAAGAGGAGLVLREGVGEGEGT